METRSRRSFRGGFIFFFSLRDLGTCSAREMCNVASAARRGPCRGMEMEGLGNLSPGFGKGLHWPWGSLGARRCPARG